MVKNRYNSLINKWKKSNHKWTNRQIENKIIELIKRSVKRSNKPLPEPCQLDKKKERITKKDEESFFESEDLKESSVGTNEYAVKSVKNIKTSN